MAADPPPQARVVLPTWLWGGNPAQLIAECEYRSRADGGRGFLLQPEERYRRRKPNLVRARTIADPSIRSGRFDDLAYLRERVEPPMPRNIDVELERRRLRAEGSGQPLDLFNYERLVMYVIPVQELPDRARYLYDLLRQMPTAEGPNDRPFSNASVHVVEIDPALLHRLKIASVWLRIEQDLRLKQGDLSHLTGVADHEQAFGSSSGLYSGVYMLDAYLAPLLASGTPGIWALNVVRTFGSLVFGLGRFISGTKGDAAEPLQLISVPGATDVVHFPELSASAGSDAVRWWVDRLNELFGVLSELAVFVDQSGDYQADKHLEAMLTVDQVFRRTASLLVAHRDTNARRTLFFSLLDSFQRVNGWDLLTMCRFSHAESVLARLETTLPGAAAEILLPAARRGVVSLQRMQDGFFIRRQLGTDDVELQLPGGETRSLALEEATARYLKVLRDATHGHGGKGKAALETAALLAHHNGEVPHEIGLLAYLYLLDMLLNPDRLRRCLYNGGR